MRAIADRMLETMDQKKLPSPSVEGYEKAHWILLDAGDVVVHVFYHTARIEYDLETLWTDAPRIDIKTGKKLPSQNKTENTAKSVIS